MASNLVIGFSAAIAVVLAINKAIRRGFSVEGGWIDITTPSRKVGQQISVD